jgi:predicted aconitase with swiveling domain
LFSQGKGSTVGSYALPNEKTVPHPGMAQKVQTIISVSAIISEIPTMNKAMSVKLERAIKSA